MVDWSQLEPEMVRPISRDEFIRMAELGMFKNQRVELLRGFVVRKMTVGRAHRDIVDWLNRELILALQRTLWVSAGNPIAASEYSQPEPDISIFEDAPDRDDHPSKPLLVIEVADSSLRRDRGIKLGIYAEAGVPEYWIIDVNAHTVEVYTRPEGTQYTHCEILRDGDVLRPICVPGVELPVAGVPY